MERTVAGDLLADFLRSVPPEVDAIRIAPPPTSWRPLKHPVLEFARSAWERGVAPPRLVGFPLCVAGHEFREIRVLPRSASHGSCRECGLSERCSPPEHWSDELQAFGSLEPLSAWKRFHERLCRALDRAPDPRLDALVELSVRRGGPRRIDDCRVEPSVLLRDDLVPTVRCAVFPGEPRGEPIRDAAEGGSLIDVFARQHALLGVSAAATVDVLRRFGPLSLPTGFEVAEDGAICLKAYVRMHGMVRSEREALARALVGVSATEETGAAEGLDWSQLQLVGLGTREGRLETVKAYFAAEPTAGLAALGLPAVAPEHPLVRLSGGQALAVADLTAPVRRPPKWDFRLRDRLLPGTIAARELGGVVPAPVAARLHALLSAPGLHVDVVAASLRGNTVGLYLEIG